MIGRLVRSEIVAIDIITLHPNSVYPSVHEFALVRPLMGKQVRHGEGCVTADVSSPPLRE